MLALTVTSTCIVPPHQGGKLGGLFITAESFGRVIGPVIFSTTFAWSISPPAQDWVEYHFVFLCGLGNLGDGVGNPNPRDFDDTRGAEGSGGNWWSYTVNATTADGDCNDKLGRTLFGVAAWWRRVRTVGMLLCVSEWSEPPEVVV